MSNIFPGETKFFLGGAFASLVADLTV